MRPDRNMQFYYIVTSTKAGMKFNSKVIGIINRIRHKPALISTEREKLQTTRIKKCVMVEAFLTSLSSIVAEPAQA